MELGIDDNGGGCNCGEVVWGDKDFAWDGDVVVVGAGAADVAAAGFSADIAAWNSCSITSWSNDVCFCFLETYNWF